MRKSIVDRIGNPGITRLEIIPGADVLVAGIKDCNAELFPEEQIGVARAVKKRRAEFAAGRSLARIALTEIGYPPRAIPQAGRVPVWPPGVVGSIAHSNEYVAVCVVSKTTFFSIGIDIEAAWRVTDDIEPRILTSVEIEDTRVTDGRTLRFACKEAVYKAVHPIVGEFFGFHAVRIDLNTVNGTFSGIPMHDGPFADHVAKGHGVFMEWRDHHLAAFSVAP